MPHLSRGRGAGGAMRGLGGLAAFGMALTLLGPASAHTLVINSNASDPAPRAAWAAAVAGFQRENPDIEVKFNVYDHDSYQRSIRDWLTGGSPDVVFWFAGTRMRGFVERGLLADVSSLFTPDVVQSLHRPAIDLVTAAGKQYGVPFSYYQIGFYFRRDLLERAGIASFPSDWA